MKISREEKLQKIIESEKLLGEIQDVDVLLERILTEARAIVHADAGSIYVVDGNNLKIKYAQNDSRLKELAPGEKLPYTFFSFPINEKSISGYVAYSNEPLNIPDAYEIPEDKPYKFNQTTDRTTDYRTKSIYTIPLKTPAGKLLGILQIINAQNDEGEVIAFDEDAELFITHFAQNAIKALENAYLTSNMVRRMLKMAEFRDPKETYPHVERVSSFSLEIYDRWAFNHNVPDSQSHKFRDTLKIAAKFHDVGKVGISDVILKKQFPRFTDEERAIMQGHTCIGANLFEPPESFLDEMCRDVALFHHERWDGGETAYPGATDFRNFVIGAPIEPARHLSGNEIPLCARIVAVADVFDALSHKRCYKEAWKIDDAFSEIQADAGRHFDPEVVLAFMQVRDRISAIQLAFPDEE
ncbi:GAF and HD-GYP domain-containing protein [Treponema sp.]|uniref:GAF and HD-GYP domain-containing protein n=1 Tax=Treponema sp. TaxID=166 RepID=UPI00298E06DA|nr:HD domain-containing phosphohydrolase [Treponema sp.]